MWEALGNSIVDNSLSNSYTKLGEKAGNKFNNKWTIITKDNNLILIKIIKIISQIYNKTIIIED